MYREQFYSAENAVKSILTHNLYGLEIDDRAMQLSRFALLLKAALMLSESAPRAARELINNPGEMLPKIYAFPENRGFISEEIGTLTDEKYVAEISKAFDLLREGKNLGSVIKLNLSDDVQQTLQSSYDKWQNKTLEGTADLIEQEIWNRLKEYFEVAITLSKKYSAVAANPPYMGQKSMNGELKDYINTYYPMTKADLMTVFMEVGGSLMQKNGKLSIINLPSWMFIASFEEYRFFLLTNYSIDSLTLLGRGVFGSDFGSVVFTLSKNTNSEKLSFFKRLTDNKVTVEDNYIKEKKFLDNSLPSFLINQNIFLSLPSYAFSFWLPERAISSYTENLRVVDISTPVQGLATGENTRFLRDWFEVDIDYIGFGLNSVEEAHSYSYKYFPYNKGGAYKKWYGNKTYIIKFDKKNAEILSKQGNKLPSSQFYFNTSITWSKVTMAGLAFRYFDGGALFDVSGCSIFAEEKTLLSLMGLFNSSLREVFVYSFSQSVNYEVGLIKSVPIKDLSHKQITINEKVNIAISISKSDWDSRETSWDFEENTLLAQQATSLQAAFNAWQEKVTASFYQLHANEQELNRIFIEIYGLQEELTPEVPLRDITILQDELKGDDLDAIEDAFRAGNRPALPIQRDIVMQQFISYLIGTMMGRYRLDKPGLHIAHPNPTDEELTSYRVERAAIPFTMTIDDDAIVPLMGDACAFPDDAVKQVQNLVHKLWGDASQVENMNFINESLGMTLDKWMTEKFWVEHISGRMYKKKPIYWMFCSNPRFPHRSAFRVLVYMHRMDQFTVQNILRKYLHTHMGHIKSQYEELNARELELSRDEMKTSEVLQKQISELNEYEEKLKHYANLQISFDLDDGVDINYAKFEGVVAKI